MLNNNNKRSKQAGKSICLAGCQEARAVSRLSWHKWDPHHQVAATQMIYHKDGAHRMRG